MKSTLSKPRLKPKKAPVKLQAATAARRAPSRQIVEDTHYDDEFEPSMKLSRAFVIVLVMHVVAVGGIFAFNAIKTRQLSETRSDKDLLPHVADETASASEVSQNRNAANTTPPEPVIPASRRHVVKTGDTPWKLSQIYGVEVDDILAVNHLKDAKIIVGQELKIPDSTRGTSAPAPQATAPAAPATRVTNTAPRPAPAASVDTDVQDLLGVKDAPKPPSPRAPDKNPTALSGKTYTVAKGDNPYKIAKKLGVDPNDLLRANNIDDPRTLQIGQQLKVPAK